MNIKISESEFEWLNSHDTGISSLTIFEVMTGLNLRPDKLRFDDHPYDPADFGRCYRLLNKFPEWKLRLREISEIYPYWKPFIENWTDLSRMYEAEYPTGSAPKMYRYMQALCNSSALIKRSNRNNKLTQDDKERI